MRRAKKREAQGFLKVLAQAHEEIKKSIVGKRLPAVLDLLEQCQSGAIELGTMIEGEEGEGFVTVSYLEQYCELTYQIHEEIAGGVWPDAIKVHKNLKKLLIQIENSVKNDISERTVAVFLPYKASMWDSLESIWLAADADAACDAYVIPIPYYDKNPDGSLRTEHYEGELLPEYVPITRYDEFDFALQEPDMIFIHNPYDNFNHVTSVHPFFYSQNLKKYTDCLVYVPYYVISGEMSEGQELCPAYLYADYIAIQTEKHRKFFHRELPQEKFLALGSPKFDRVIRLCQNPPKPPEHWKKKMAVSDGNTESRKKIYFYNTSINGMLADTKSFLNKMEYVFRCFLGREDACLIWRPHPLLESTFDSMRREFRPFYDALKKFYIEQEVGIYDDTPDIEHTIALCDAYIGDPASSVIPLFGIAGKPLFIFNNNINTAPEADDWRGEIIRGFLPDGQDDWTITQGNRLYHAPNHDYRYEYYCDLSEYSGGNYYSRALEIGGKVYVCPGNGHDILVIEEKKIKRRVGLNRYSERSGAFVGAWKVDGYLFLIPFRYPAIVRYDTVKDEVTYLEGYQEIFAGNVQGEWRLGGNCVWNGYLLFASPTDDRVLAIRGKTGQAEIWHTGAGQTGGCMIMVSADTSGGALSDEEIWLLPFSGTTVACWNPATGQIREYGDIPGNVPAGFQCKNVPHGQVCGDRPFNMAVRCKEKMYFAPCWGNMFLCLDTGTGEFCEWEPPFPLLKERKNGYYDSWSVGTFFYRQDELARWPYRFFSCYDRRMYAVDLESGEYQEIEIRFEPDEMKKLEPGFAEESEWLPYACLENVFQPLGQFLDGNVAGNPFDRDRQLRAFGKITANTDGTSGEQIYRFVSGKDTGGKGL